MFLKQDVFPALYSTSFTAQTLSPSTIVLHLTIPLYILNILYIMPQSSPKINQLQTGLSSDNVLTMFYEPTNNNRARI